MQLEYMTDDQIRDYLRTTKPNGIDAVAPNVQKNRINAINELVKRDVMSQTNKPSRKTHPRRIELDA